MIENLNPNFNNEEYCTTHEFWYTPARIPKLKGSVCYITHGMPTPFLLSPVYAIHKLRSLWMLEKGKLGLVIGEVWKKVSIPGTIDIWTFSNDCIISETKKGALKVDKRHFIKFQVMTAPEVFMGSTRVELDGETVLVYMVDNSVGNSNRR